MIAASVGSLSFLPSQGRLGVVVGAQAVGAPKQGRQLMALKVKSLPETPSGAARGVPDQPSRSSAGLQAGIAGQSGAKAEPAEPEPRDQARPTILDRESSGPRPAARGPNELSAEERMVVDRLRQRDSQVRQEERAHAAVAGDLAGPISYVYQRGPDGRLYAVGGSVAVQAQSISGDPREAAEIGARMAAAGHAATNPSGADLAAVRVGYRLQGNAEQSQQQGRADLELTV